MPSLDFENEIHFLKAYFFVRMPRITDRIPGRPPTITLTLKCAYKLSKRQQQAFHGGVGEVLLRTSTAWKHLHKNINKISY